MLLDTLHYNTPALSTTLALSSYGLSMPATVFVKRAVQNLLCQTEWKISENAAVWRFGQNEEQTSHVNICERDLPYNYTYTFADGHTQNFLFTSANQRFELTDLTEETPNGFEPTFVPKGKEFDERRREAREALRKVAGEKLGGVVPPNALFVCISGRQEWKNKGIDVFASALDKLAQKIYHSDQPEREVIAFIMIPSSSFCATLPRFSSSLRHT